MTTALPRAGLVVRAHAKINLSLRILGRRPDGFHDLRTTFQSLELHDTVTFVAREGPFELRCSDTGLPGDERNLVSRAAAALWHAVGRVGPVRDLFVQLEKRIPVEAGLGGGSSDAAAALVGLATLWKLSLSREQVVELAAVLGADVPFFLTGGTALGLGRGDLIYPLPDLPPYHIVLLLPHVRIPTAQAYGWYDDDPAGHTAPRFQVDRLPPGWPTQLGPVRNDLEPTIARRVPAIAELVATLRRRGAVAAALTGSGAAVFGLFPDGESARDAAQHDPAVRQAMVTRAIGHEEFVAGLGPTSIELPSGLLGGTNIV